MGFEGGSRGVHGVLQFGYGGPEAPCRGHQALYGSGWGVHKSPAESPHAVVPAAVVHQVTHPFPHPVTHPCTCPHTHSSPCAPHTSPITPPLCPLPPSAPCPSHPLPPTPHPHFHLLLISSLAVSLCSCCYLLFCFTDCPSQREAWLKHEASLESCLAVFHSSSPTTV